MADPPQSNPYAEFAQPAQSNPAQVTSGASSPYAEFQQAAPTQAAPEQPGLYTRIGSRLKQNLNPMAMGQAVTSGITDIKNRLQQPYVPGSGLKETWQSLKKTYSDPANAIGDALGGYIMGQAGSEGAIETSVDRLNRSTPSTAGDTASAPAQYAYRTRTVGEQGIPATRGAASATSDLAQAKSYVQSRGDIESAPQEVVRVNLGKLKPGAYTAADHPSGAQWYRFHNDIPESAIQRVK